MEVRRDRGRGSRLRLREEDKAGGRGPRSAAAGACGGCGDRRLQVGPGASVARARQVRLCGRCGLVERRRGRAGLRGMGRAELGQAGGGGPSAEEQPWDRAGPAGRGRGKGGGPRRGWVGLRVWAGVLGLGSFSISIYSLFSILIQTKVEFKYQFEFKPHSIN